MKTYREWWFGSTRYYPSHKMLATFLVSSTFFHYPDKFCAGKFVGPIVSLERVEVKRHTRTGHEGPKGE